MVQNRGADGRDGHGEALRGGPDGFDHIFITVGAGLVGSTTDL